MTASAPSSRRRDVAGWLARSLNYKKLPPASEFGLRVAELLEDWLFGLHHLPDTWAKHTRFDDEERVELVINGGLDTYDFDRLTRLVFLAHDRCIRVEVEGASRGYLRVWFSPRQREGRIYNSHPTLDEAIAMHRRYHPAPTVSRLPQDQEGSADPQ